LPPYYAEQDDTFLKRFQQEAKAIASLRHPNILIVIDYGEHNETTYIVMEFVEAGTLTELMGKPMAPGQMMGLIDQVAGALHYAHEKGVVHRDIKPSNILLPKPDWPLLTDFGLAKIVGGSQLTQSGTIAGTPAYMSPEQGRGEKVDLRSDIYSLGIVLYEMATGVVPFHAETPMAVVVKHIIDPLPLPRSKNPELPEEIERVILKALSKDPEDRFQDADEMSKAMKQAVRELPSSVAEAVPAVPAGQASTIVEPSTDVEAAERAAAVLAAQQAADVRSESEPQVAEGLKDPAVAPTASGGLLSSPRRIAAAVIGGLLVLAVVVVGAVQLFGDTIEEPEDLRTQEQIVADARAQLEGDDPSAAIEDLDRAIEGDPENPDLYFERAWAEAAAGETDLGRETVFQGIEIAPDESWVHEQGASILWELGFFDEAISEFRIAVDLDPSAYWIYYSIAEIYMQTGRLEPAVANLQTALENPSIAADPDEINSIGWFLLSLERFGEAEAVFNRAIEIAPIEIAPDNPSMYEGLIELAYTRGGAQAGVEMLEIGIQQFPEHSPFYESGGYWLWELGDLDQAIQAFNRAIELDPSNPGNYGSLASLLVETGREGEAEELIRRGLERYPNSPESHVVAADFYMAVGDIGEAISLYQRSIELNPDDPWLFASYARATAETGGHDTARELLAEASAGNPGDPWLDEFIGWTYMMMDDCEQAVDHFERALAVDPSIESAEQGIQECGG
jgi:tetratricopeptide (TPR) repeat protein